MFITIIGYMAMLTTIIGIIPQFIKGFITKSTKDVSMLMLINCFICSLTWLVYGVFCLNDSFVIFSNLVSTITSILSIIQKIVYDNKYKKIL